MENLLLSYKLLCRSGIWLCYWAGVVKNRLFCEAPLLGRVANHRHHCRFCEYLNNQCSNQESDNWLVIRKALSRFLGHEPPYVPLGVVGTVPFQPQLRPEEGRRLDACHLDSPAVFWREDCLARDSSQLVLGVPCDFESGVVVFLQGQLRVQPDA